MGVFVAILMIASVFIVGYSALNSVDTKQNNEAK